MLMTADQCAQALLDSIPEVMQVIRAQIRRQRDADLSVPQLRVLGFLSRHPGATLSSVAEHVGLTLSSMSLQITALVARNLIDRSESPSDRRCITLTLTAEGTAMLEAAIHGARLKLAATLDMLDFEQRTTIIEAMHILHSVFSANFNDELE
jgi:DNA-binding MarR family transcriptional regulator